MSGWNSKWSNNIDELLAQKGHRNSAVKIFDRIRSGSLPGWIGGGGSSLGSGGFQSQQQSPTPISPQNQNDSHFSEQPQTSSNEMSGTLSTTIGDKTGSSTSIASPCNSTATDCTVSTSRCMVTNPLNPQDATGMVSVVDEDFRDELLPSKSTPTTDNLLYPHPISIESSPLNPRRKNKFTIVPLQKRTPLDVKATKRQGNEALGLIVSALYGKLLVVMGIAFPMAEVISTYIPPSFYDGFYLYLYFGSITFMICIYGNILRQKASRSVRCTLQRINTMRSRLTTVNSNGGIAPDVTTNEQTDDASSDSEGSCSDSPLPCPVGTHMSRGCKLSTKSGRGNSMGMDTHCGASTPDACQQIHFGSFYLRMGAVAFGIGSMIYSGLEFGQYFELDPDTKCHNFMIALTPAVRMIFTFMQMYFIFLNSKMAVYKLHVGAQFGLMHMIGTNMCVWLNVLVQETRHEILNFYNPDNGTITYPSSHQTHQPFIPRGYGIPKETVSPHDPSHPSDVFGIPSVVNATVSHLVSAVGAHHRVRRGLKGPYSMYECRRSDIMGSLVQNASPFLFPCTIEYSLICAAILYVMWKSMATSINSRRDDHGHIHNGDLNMFAGSKRSPHTYSVDCARANKGLFLGIFVLVMTIISLILFFVLITRPGYQALAVVEVNITELVLYTMTTLAVLIGMCQMRELRYVSGRNLELDNILLIVAQTGSFIYNVFTIIGGHFTMKKNTVLVLMTALSSLIQLLLQTLFILDASKRSAANKEQARRKPGREVVTFLLVTNLAMWAINTLEKSRADSHPVQLKFYGVWAWTIITHISMPLAIFYRFHSTVCLCEIWKRAYKIKPSIYR